jgi:hypothetical protein
MERSDSGKKRRIGRTAAELRRKAANEPTLFPPTEKINNQNWIDGYRAGVLARCTIDEIEDVTKIENN